MKLILTVALYVLALSGCASKGNDNSGQGNYASACRMAGPFPGSRLGPTCNPGLTWPQDTMAPFYSAAGSYRLREPQERNPPANLLPDRQILSRPDLKS
jgi:hypothetical protein